MESDPVLSEYGYGFGVLNAADYGVPQRRRRGIFVAIRGLKEVPWPPPVSHGPDSADGTPYATVREALDGLALMPEITDIALDDENRQDLHFRRQPRPMSLERYQAVPEGGNRFDLARNRPDLLPRCWANKATGTTDVMGRLWWDRPSVTIRTEFFKPDTCTPSPTERSPIARPPGSRRSPTASSSTAPRRKSPGRSATPCPPCWLERSPCTSMT